MKAALASALTALVLVSTAWASNVTPAQLSALSRRVAQLQRANSTLAVRVTKLEESDATLSPIVICLRAGWNAQSTTAYAVSTWGGFDTKSGNLNIFVTPEPADGITGQGYLVTSPAPAPSTGC